MIPRCIEQACITLSRSERTELNREIVAAFSALKAFSHHYPSQTSPLIHDQISRFSWVQAKEPSRYLKQRRLALVKIQADLSIFAASQN